MITKFLLLTLSLFATIGQVVAQDSELSYKQKKDSLNNLQRQSGELYMKYKDTDFDKAAVHSKRGNELFAQSQQLVLSYVKEVGGKASKIVVDELYMFDYDLKAITSLYETVKSIKGFDAEVLARVEKAYQALNGESMLGEMAPAFSYDNNNGKKVSLTAFKGRYVWLNFWASWCTPCRVKSRQIVPHAEELKKMGLEIISVSLDDKREDWIAAHIKDGIVWTSLWDSKGFKGYEGKHPYNVKRLPTTFLIAPDGKIVLESPDYEDVVNYLKNIK